MKTRARLKPGQKGTKKLLDQYGDRLVCVRYLYDETTQKRFKTIELIIDEAPWKPPPRPTYPPMALVPIKINVDEPKLQELARHAGGRWDSKQKIWWVQFGNIVGTKLEKRIAIQTSKNSTAP